MMFISKTWVPNDTNKVWGFVMWCRGAWCGFVMSAWQCRTWRKCIVPIGTKRSISTRHRIQMSFSLDQWTAWHFWWAWFLMIKICFCTFLVSELQVIIWFIPSKLNIALTNVMAHIYTHHHKCWICRICCVVVECALGCQEHVDMHIHGHGSCRSVLGIMLTLPMLCFGR